MIPKIHYNILAIALLLPAVLLANHTTPRTVVKKTIKEKTISKTFNVNTDAVIKIENSYGNIDILTSNTNTAEFDIVIRVSGENQDKIDERLQDIDVQFSATNAMISATTIIPKRNKGWWCWSGKSNLKFEINYVVKIPTTNHLKISNNYGTINVDKLEGSAALNCDYGKIITKELMSEDNTLRFDYSKGCYFEYINAGDINADYSSYTVGKAKSLAVKADYTKSEIEAAENVTYTCDYGSLTVDNINTLQGNGDYLALRISNVYKDLSVKANYGAIKIGRMTPNAGNVNINSNYTGITVGYDTAYNFDFTIKLDYASLRNTEGFNFVKKRIESSSKYFEGSYGNSNSGNKVLIDSEYGSVTFKPQ